MSTPPVKSSVTDEDNSQRVSHGASEKQRRDRINSMIDQLRVLVPPKGGAQCNSSASTADQAIIEGKRSKYAVLAETNQLISVQQRQLQEKDAELQRLREWKRQREEEGCKPERSGEGHHEVSSLEQEMLKTQMLSLKSPATSFARRAVGAAVLVVRLLAGCTKHLRSITAEADGPTRVPGGQSRGA